MFSLCSKWRSRGLYEMLLQTLVVEITGVCLEATFPTSCRGHLVLCAWLLFGLWVGVTTERTIGFHRPVMLLVLLKKQKTTYHWILLPCLSKKGSISFFYTSLAHGVEATLKSMLIKKSNCHRLIEILMTLL